MKKLLLLGLAAALTSAAFAFPTILGPTGGLAVPSAAIQDGVAVSVQRAELQLTELPLIYVNAGVLPNLELGVVYSDFTIPVLTGANDTLKAINAKFALPFDFYGTGLAAGASYNEIGEFDWLNLYVAGTFPVSDTVNLTGALVYTDPDEGDEDFGFGLGLEQTFDNGSVVGVEYTSTNYPTDALIGGATGGVLDLNATLNAYVAMPVNEAVTLRFGWIGITDVTEFVLGASYAFGAAE